MCEFNNKIAILMVTRNSSHILPLFFESFNKYVDGDKYDLYVYDNGSRDGDLELLDFYEDRGFIKEIVCNITPKNLLFTHAINTLIAIVKHRDYNQFILVNPDVEFTLNWDKNLDNNSGVMGFILVKENGVIEHAGAYGNGEHVGRGEKDLSKYSGIREVDWVSFGIVAIHKNVIEKCGRLDAENYPHFGSDREYSRKARENGFPVTCCDAVLTHLYGFSTRPYILGGDVPESIWRQHVLERKNAGVYFPDSQEEVKIHYVDQTRMARRIVYGNDST